MSLTDSEIMGGVGFGDDLYNFYDHAENIDHLVKHGRRATDPFDQITPAHTTYGGPYNPGPKSYTAPEDLDNGDTVQKYLLNRLSSTSKLPVFREHATDGMSTGGASATTAREKMENMVKKTLGEHAISTLLTFIFILIVVIIVLQIMHTRKLYKLVKKMLKICKSPVLVMADKNTS